MYMLEDYKRGLVVRLVQISNIFGILQGVKGLYVPLVDKDTQYKSLVLIIVLNFKFQHFIFLRVYFFHTGNKIKKIAQKQKQKSGNVNSPSLPSQVTSHSCNWHQSWLRQLNPRYGQTWLLRNHSYKMVALPKNH